jgi:hypothetical protein
MFVTVKWLGAAIVVILETQWDAAKKMGFDEVYLK